MNAAYHDRLLATIQLAGAAAQKLTDHSALDSQRDCQKSARVKRLLSAIQNDSKSSAQAWLFLVPALLFVALLFAYHSYRSSLVIDGVRWFWLDDDQMISM